MKQKLLLSVILGLIFLVMGVGIWKLQPNSKKVGKPMGVSVVTSFYPLYYMTREISGDIVNVTNITPAGSEPHDYEPTAKDMAKIQQSKLLLLNGNGFEAWGEKVKEEVKDSGVKVIEVGEGLFEGNDPHIWLSPELAIKEARKILMSLVEVSPGDKDFYTNNEIVLEKKLEDLQMKYREGLANCQKKEFVSSHDAFGYLAREFGLTQIAISGLSPDEEPSAKDLAAIAKLAKDKGIKFIFFETLVSPKLAETVANEIGAQTLVLDPIEGIDDEGLANGKNYISVMEQNLVNLQTALECK